MSVGTADSSITIPKGDPDALADAASAWEHLGSSLTHSAHAIQTDAMAPIAAASWKGTAAIVFSGRCDAIVGSLEAAARGCEVASRAARTFSHELRAAQDDAKKALREWKTAEGERTRAVAAAEGAARSAQGHRDAATAARSSAQTARATPGGAREHAAETYDAAARQADSQAASDEADARRANARVDSAVKDQTDAEAAGRKANQRAKDAARTAGNAFEHAAGDIDLPDDLGPPPVPVDPTPATTSNPFGPMPGLGTPFGVTPGDIRRQQIEQDAKDLKRLEDYAKKRQKGSIGDGIKGLVNSATFGAVDPGGNKGSARYNGGEIAGLLVPVGGVVKGLGKAVKVVKDYEEAEKASRIKAAEDAAEKRVRDSRAGGNVNPKLIELARQRAAAATRKAISSEETSKIKLEYIAKAVEELVGPAQEIARIPADMRIPSQVAGELVRNYKTIMDSAAWRTLPGHVRQSIIDAVSRLKRG